MKDAVVSTLVVAVVATAGDWIWATFLSRHLMAAGLVHGALLCLAMGAMAARPAGRAAFGAAAGLGIGLGSAALFYALAPILRTGAMFVAWFALWMLLAAVSGARWMPIRHRVGRGVAAGCASGLAFYAVSGMWTRWDPAAVDYADHFGRWLVAFAPGFLALQAATPPRARAAGTASDII
jgi:hypothetical protein